MKSGKENKLIYPPEECLHFIYSAYSPEKFLLIEYLKEHPNRSLDYHVNNSDPHCLFEKMIENSICVTKDEAFDKCWDIFLRTTEGQSYFQELKEFILKMVNKYSPDL